MPRRNRMAAYDNVVDDMEYQPYSRRTKGEPLFDMDARYGQRIPHEPVQEILERRHVREKVKPEIPRESYEYLEDDAMAADRLSRLDLNAYSPESINNYVKQRISGRQARGRPPSSDSGDDDDAFFSPEEAKELYTESGSDSDEIEEYIENKKRTGTRHKPEVRKEHLPRSKQVKEEKRSRRAVIEEPVFTKSSRSVEESTRERKGPRVAARPRPQHRSHYDLGLEEEDDETESDESDDEIIETIPKPSRRRVTKRDRVERKYSTQKGDVSSSSSILSSSESLGSSESELPKVPLPIPIPPIHKDSPRRHKSLGHGKDIRGPFTTAAPPLAETGFQIPSPPSPPTPPRVPSLETVLSEREARKRLEKAAKGVVEVERRSKETLVLPPEPPAPPAPPAPPVRRKKEKPVTIVETPEPVGHTGSRVRDERGGPRASFERREIIEEEDYYRSRDPRWSSPSSGATDDWAIVHAPPRQRKSPAKEVVDVREERQSRRKQQLSRAPEVEDGELRPKGERRSRSKPGPRYIGVRDRKERLWTEITKDLVVKEAIERAGLEYEEMDSVYYIFAYLHPDDVNALVADSDQIRHERRRRIKEIQRERASLPPKRRSPAKQAPPPVEQAPSPQPPPRPHREDRRRKDWDRVQEEEIMEYMARAPNAPAPPPVERIPSPPRPRREDRRRKDWDRMQEEEIMEYMARAPNVPAPPPVERIPSPPRPSRESRRRRDRDRAREEEIVEERRYMPRPPNVPAPLPAERAPSPPQGHRDDRRRRNWEEEVEEERRYMARSPKMPGLFPTERAPSPPPPPRQPREGRRRRDWEREQERERELEEDLEEERRYRARGGRW